MARKSVKAGKKTKKNAGASEENTASNTAEVSSRAGQSIQEMTRTLEDLKKQGFRLGKLKDLSKYDETEAASLFENYLSAVKMAEELGDRLSAAGPYIPSRKLSALRTRLKNPLEASKLAGEIVSLEQSASARYEQLLLQAREYQARGYRVDDLLKALDAGSQDVVKLADKTRESVEKAERARRDFEALDQNAFPREAAEIRQALAGLERMDWVLGRIAELQNLSNTKGRDLEQRIQRLSDMGFNTGRLSLARGLDLETMQEWVREFEELAERRPELEERIGACDFSSWPGLEEELRDLLPDPYSYEELDQRLETHGAVVAEERENHVRSLASMGETFTGRDSSAIAQAGVEKLRQWAAEAGEAWKLAQETLKDLNQLDTSLFGALADRVRQLAQRHETVAEAAAELSVLRSRVRGAEASLEREIETFQESGYSVYLLVESANRNLASRYASLKDLSQRIAGLQEIGRQLEKLDVSLFIEEASLIRAALRSPEDLEMIQARFQELSASVEEARRSLERRIDTLREQGCDVSSLLTALQENDLFFARNSVEGFSASMDMTSSLRERVLAMRCGSLQGECDAILESLRDPSMAASVADRVEGLSLRAEARRESILGRISDLAASGFVVDFISLAAMDLEALEKAFSEITAAVARADDMKDRLESLDFSCHVSSAEKIRRMLRRPSEVRAAALALERLESKIEKERQELVGKVRELASLGFSVGPLMTAVQEQPAIHARAAILDFNVKAETARSMGQEIRAVDARAFPAEARQLEVLARDPGRLGELQELLHTVRVRERTRIAEVESEAASLRDEGFIFQELPQGSLFEMRQALNSLREALGRTRGLLKKLESLDTTLYPDEAQEVSRLLMDLSRLREGRLALVRLESRIRGGRRELEERVALFRRRGYCVDSLPQNAPMAELSRALDGFAQAVRSLEELSRELESLDTSLFPSEKLRVLKELKNPAALEKARSEVSGLARRIEMEREALAGRILNLADRGFMVPPVEEIVTDRLSNVAMRVKRLEQAAEEAGRLLARLEDLDAYPFPEEESRVRGLAMDLTSLAEARAALDSLERRCRQALDEASARVAAWRQEGLVVDSLLKILPTGNLRRINETMAAYEENLSRLRNANFRLGNLQSSVFSDLCDQIREMLSDPSTIDRIDVALSLLEEQTGEAFGELANLVEDYRSQGLLVEELEKALCGELDGAMEIFQAYQRDLDASRELLREMDASDLSLYREQESSIRELLGNPSRVSECRERFRNLQDSTREEDGRLRSLLRNWKETGFDISSLRGAEVLPLARKKVSYAAYAQSLEELRDLEGEIRDCQDVVDAAIIDRAGRFLRNPARLSDARRLRDEIVKMAEERRLRSRRVDELSGLLESLDTSIFSEDRARILSLLKGKAEVEKAEASLETLINRINEELKGYGAFIRSMEMAGFDTLRLRRAREEGSSIRELWETVELFRADTAHLKRLQDQLEGMDTSLFQAQAQVITAKCKSPDLISEIEDNLANLADLILRKGEAQSTEIAEFRQEGFIVSALDEIGITQAEREERIKSFRIRAGHARGLMGSLRTRDYSPFGSDLEALAELCRDPDRLEEAEKLIALMDEKVSAFKEELGFRMENLLQRGFLVDTADLGDKGLTEQAAALDRMEEAAARLTDARSRLEALPPSLFQKEVAGLLPFVSDLRATVPIREALEYLELRYSTMLSLMDSIIQRYGDEGYTTLELQEARNHFPETFEHILAEFEEKVSVLMRIRVRLRPLQPEVCMADFQSRSSVLYDTSRTSQAAELLEEAERAFQNLREKRVAELKNLAGKGFIVRDRMIREIRSLASNEELTQRWKELSTSFDRLARLQDRLNAMDTGRAFSSEATALLKVTRDPERVEEAERGVAGLESALRSSRREMAARVKALGAQGYSFQLKGEVETLTFSDLEALLADLEDREARVSALLGDLERYREIPSCSAEVAELSSLVRDLSMVGSLEEKFRVLASKVSQHFRNQMESYESRGYMVESLRMSLGEPVDVMQRVFSRYASQVEQMERLSEIIGGLDQSCYEDELRPLAEMLRDPSLAGSATMTLDKIIERMKAEDEEYDFESQWFTRRGFDTGKLGEGRKVDRLRRRAMMSEFREKVTRCERYSRMLDTLAVVFPEIDMSAERELLTRPFKIVAFEKRLKTLTDRIRERASLRLARWKGYGFGWGSLMEGLQRDPSLFAESFALYEKTASEAAAYMDAATASRSLSRDPAFKAISLALRNPLALPSVREELDALFSSYSIDIFREAESKGSDES